MPDIAEFVEAITRTTQAIADAQLASNASIEALTTTQGTTTRAILDLQAQVDEVRKENAAILHRLDQILESLRTRDEVH